MWRLVTTSHFDRQVDRFVRAHPSLKSRLAQVLRDLEADPSQPHLRVHTLRGELEGLHALRLTYAYRITLSLDRDQQEIVLVDVGSHDELYG